MPCEMNNEQTFEELEREAQNICSNDEDALIRLFEIWKKAHKVDNEVHKNCPDPENENHIKSFIVDGYAVDRDYFESAANKVLFLLKEAAVVNSDEQYYGSDSIDEQWDCHWYKRLMNNHEKELRGSLYYDKFKDMCDSLNLTDVRRTAMMNINKRGGFNSGTNQRILGNYIRKYRYFLLKQIEIMNPDIIVSCIGPQWMTELLFEDFADIKPICISKDNDWNTKNRKLYVGKMKDIDNRIIGMYHPGYFAISKENYKIIFDAVLDREEYKN